jgi:hypothetical protein
MLNYPKNCGVLCDVFWSLDGGSNSTKDRMVFRGLRLVRDDFWKTLFGLLLRSCSRMSCWRCCGDYDQMKMILCCGRRLKRLPQPRLSCGIEKTGEFHGLLPWQKRLRTLRRKLLQERRPRLLRRFLSFQE